MQDKRTAMVVGAHPDDPDFAVGGTVAKWARDGWRMVYVVCTNGDKGSSDPEMTSERLAVLRDPEQRASARVLGASDVEMLGHPDGCLEDTIAFRGELVRLIRKYRPERVLAHDPHGRHPVHRDHRMAGMATLDAVFPAAGNPMFYAEHRAEGLTPHKVKEVYLWGSEDPDTFVDISDVWDTKIKAVACHVSQVGDHSADWDTWIQQRKERAIAMSRRPDMPLSEAFRRVELRW